MSDKWNTLAQKGAKLYEQGKYNEALYYHIEACVKAKKVFGENHPQYATNLINLAQLYGEMGEYGKAEPLIQQAMDIYKRTLGAAHPYYATGLNNLAEIYRMTGQYSKAEPLYLQVIDICERKLGEDHPNYISVLNNLATLYQAEGDYHKAEPLYRQVTDICKRVLGENHPDYATSLNNLGLTYQSMGEFHKAELIYRQALDIRRKALGINHPDYATSLNNLAELYRIMGEYQKAEPLYKQALDILKKGLGVNHLNYAFSLNNLALLYDAMGEYQKAEPLFQQAMDIRKKTLGPDHPDYAASLENLASLYNSIGEYNRAEPLFQQAADIWKSTLGTEHPYYAQSLNNLAVFYQAMNEYHKAVPLLLQAIEIRKKTLGEAHPDYGQSLNNLAMVYRTMGDYEKAVPLYLEATNIRGKALGKDHPDYAQSLNNLGALLHSIGEYQKAESLYLQAAMIRKKAFGEAHPDYATSLNNLAVIYKALGDYPKAGQLYQKAADIRKNALGEDHPDYTTSLNNLASFEIVTGQPQVALNRMIHATRIDNKMITQMFNMGDEKRVAEYIQTFQANLNALLSNFTQHYPELTKSTPWVFDLILQRKALNLEIAAIRRDHLIANENPELQVRFLEIRQKRMAYASLIMAGPGKTTPIIYQRDIQQLEQEIVSLESALASQVPRVELEKKLANADHMMVANLLPKATALIEIIWYRPFDFKNNCLLAPRYLAFTLCQDHPENVQMIDLGAASDLDETIIKYRGEIIKNISIEDEYNTGILLYQKLFQPLLDHIGGAKKLLISTDGNITLLPFEVLPQPNGCYVIEDFEISYMDSGRDLLRFSYRENPRTKALVLADPDFDLALLDSDYFGPGVSNQTAIRGKMNWTDIPGRPSVELERLFRGGPMNEPGNGHCYEPLPGTRAEGEMIKDLMDINLWMGGQVLDARVKQVRGPKILHIATHGYFLPKSVADDPDLLIQRMQVGYQEQSPVAGKIMENPLLRSGLVLAGINTFIQGKESVPEAEDGLLTALDVTGMDLIGTDLVVLSACQTGLGDVQAGEGIYGLRRAFTIAGARTIIVSLWKVPDQATQWLMAGFYRRLVQGLPKATALRETQREMIRQLRRADQPTSPIFWGAFVCVGDPGMMEL